MARLYKQGLHSLDYVLLLYMQELHRVPNLCYYGSKHLNNARICLSML